MVDNIVNEFSPDYVSPPGDTLAEVLEARQMKQKELAGRTGRSAKHINEIIKGIAAITPAAAIQLERALGIPASFWNNRQRRYNEYLAHVEEEHALRANTEWARNFPYAVLARRGLVDEVRDRVARLRSLLDFFGTATPEAWERHWGGVRVAYRTSQTYEPDQYALAAWLRMGELVGQQIECAPYSFDKFLSCLQTVRGLTPDKPSAFQDRLIEICAACGVAVAFVRELPKTASGATRWLSRDKALLQLSLKYKTDDHLWFTFFHEAGHILLHQRRNIFIEGRRYGSKEELEADRFAADMLISPADFQRLAAATRYSKAFVRAFAQQIGIAPGIVVGRLQNADLIPHSHLNDLKRRLYWANDSR